MENPPGGGGGEGGGGGVGGANTVVYYNISDSLTTGSEALGSYIQSRKWSITQIWGRHGKKGK